MRLFFRNTIISYNDASWSISQTQILCYGFQGRQGLGFNIEMIWIVIPEENKIAIQG